MRPRRGAAQKFRNELYSNYDMTCVPILQRSALVQKLHTEYKCRATPLYRRLPRTFASRFIFPPTIVPPTRRL